MGRPEVITPEILERLRHAFAIGCTDEEACAYAKVPTSTFYDYQKRHPDFSEEKERLKQEPILKAKNTIVQSLNDVKDAQWYLERKKKDEFSTRSEFTGEDGKEIVVKVIDYGDNDQSTT